MPKLCGHDDPSWCGPDCEEKVRQFDEWMQRNLKDNRRSTLTQQGEVHARTRIGREARVEHQPQGADEVQVGVSAGGDEGMPGCGSMGDSVTTRTRPKDREQVKRRERMREMVAKFQDYTRTYSGQSHYEDYSDKTFLDDMLYGIGLSMQVGTPTDYTGAGGYERFKQKLLEHLGSGHTRLSKP